MDYVKCSRCGSEGGWDGCPDYFCPAEYENEQADQLAIKEEAMISEALSNTTWSGAKEYVEALKRNGFQDWKLLPELFRAYEQITAQSA